MKRLRASYDAVFLSVRLFHRRRGFLAELLVSALGDEIGEEMLTACCIALMWLVSLHLRLPLALCISSGFDVFELGSVAEAQRETARPPPAPVNGKKPRRESNEK